MSKKRPTKNKSSELNAWLFGGAAVLFFAAVIAGGLYLTGRGSSGSSDVVTGAAPRRANNCSGSTVLKTGLPGVEHALCEGQQHVADGTRVAYQSDPPTSGNHWAGATPPGFYAPGNEALTLPERLVHALEHGNVVIYYDPGVITADQQERLKALYRKWPGNWDGVVAVPRTDSANPIILTAWEYSLKLSQWDEGRINDFVREFAGRGPENPMR